MAQESDIVGKKIFFLYPSVVVQNRITEEFVQQEFEVYTIKDHKKLRDMLTKYPNSIVFTNIHEGMSEQEWETWIRDVQTDPQTSGVSVGIIAQGEDDSLKQKYLYDVKIKGGYTILKSDLTLAMKQLFDILTSLDAKGRRKHLRTLLDNEVNATVNFSRNGIYIKGAIKDISVVGLSCFFTEDPVLAKNSLFQDIQIKLQSSLLKAEGIVFGSRLDGTNKVYVILFTPRMDPDTKSRIRKFIQSNLQAKMELES
jgi:flavodoxin